MPVQEPGVRPARPLPYQPDASATTGAGSVTVALRNTGKASAHFARYPYAGEFTVPQHQDVRGEGEWTVPVPGDHYRFTITGPNGFRREFEGPAAGGAELATRVDHHDRDLHLTVRNTGSAPLAFDLRPLGTWTRTTSPTGPAPSP